MLKAKNLSIASINEYLDIIYQYVTAPNFLVFFKIHSRLDSLHKEQRLEQSFLKSTYKIKYVQWEQPVLWECVSFF